MAANQVYTSVQKIIEEKLNPKIMRQELTMSKFFRRIFRTSDGVFLDPYTGRDWKIIKTFETGLGGAFDFEGVPGAGSMTTDPAVNTFQIYSVQSGFQGLTEATVPGYGQITIQLKRGRGNAFFPLELFQLAKLGASIGNQIDATLNATARMLALWKMNAFYRTTSSGTQITDGTAGVIAQFTASATMTLTSTSATAQTILTGSSVRRLRTGMAVDLYASGSRTRLNGGTNTNQPLFVDIVNEYEGTFKLFSFSGSGVNITNAVTYDLVIKNCGRDSTSSNLPAALDSVITSAASGTAVYGIDLALFPFFRSYVATPGTAGGGPLTEEELFRHLGTMIHAREASLGVPDYLCAPEGVWSYYFQNLPSTSHIYYFNRQGQKLDNTKWGMAGLGDDEDIVMNVFGHKFSLASDPWIAGASLSGTSGTNTGTLYGLVTTDNNWKMYAPPRVPGARGKPGFDAGIQFLAPAMMPGADSVFLPSLNSSAGYTNFLQTPFWYPYEIAPDIIPGFKLTSIAESYGNPTGS